MIEKWNGNSFTVYGEEESMLELVEGIPYGDHKGSWQGIEKPILSEEGIRGIVEQLQEMEYLMPYPSNVSYDTTLLQSVLDKAKTGKCKITVKFRDGVYNLNELTIYKNTTLELNQDTILNHVLLNKNIFISNAKVLSDESINITGYNGHGNIAIMGGTIKAYCSLVMVHGENIKIIGTKFKECKSDHFIQIGACKNVLIEKCSFNGMITPSAEREYVEMVQVDFMNELALPYWTSGSPIYDNTVNDGFIVKDCYFGKGSNGYEYIGSAFGSHGSDLTYRNKNISFINNVVEGCSYSGVSLKLMENVICRDNVIKGDGVSGNLIRIEDSLNVISDNDYVENSRRSFFITGNNNVKVVNPTISNIVNESDYFIIGETENAIIDNVLFKNSSLAPYMMLVRNCKNVVVNNVIDTMNGNETAIIRTYALDGNTCDRISVTNINSSKLPLSNSSGTNIITKYLDETIYSGSEFISNITLSDKLSNFEDLKIVLSWYGDREYLVNKVSNYITLSDTNISDDGVNTTFNILEMKIKVVDEANLLVEVNNQLNNSGSSSFTTSQAYVKKIYGKRKRFS